MLDPQISSHSDAAPERHRRPRPRVVFFANGVYGTHVSGGDIHFIEIAQAAKQAGHETVAFGSKVVAERFGSTGRLDRVLVTSERKFGSDIEQGIRGQLMLLWDYFLRTYRSVKLLKHITSDDVAYAIADSWCDTLPLVFSRAKCKMLVLHMEAPRLSQILLRSRPDVDRFRVAAVHYWISQKLALTLLRTTRHKRIFYVHPAMRELLLGCGFQPSEISPISFGLDTTAAATVPDQPKTYDVAWIGRLHRQKGIPDLVATLTHLSQSLPKFRAILIGRGAEELKPEIERRNLAQFVDFSGLVSEEEKMRLLKSSRVFLMPSRHEGSPRTIAEALLARIPVVAYAVPTYEPVFGSMLQYVPCFDSDALAREAEAQIVRMRLGQNCLSESTVVTFARQHSWEAVRDCFRNALKAVTPSPVKQG